MNTESLHVKYALLSILEDNRLAKELLEKSELRFRSVIENANEGICITDEKGKIFVWNTVLEKLTNTDSQQMIGLYLWELTQLLQLDSQYYSAIPLPTQIEIENLLQTGASSFTDAPFVVHYKNLKQQLFVLSVKINTVKTKNGFLLSIVADDITQAHNAELALKESEQLFASFMNNSPILAWVKDENLNYVYLNRAFENLKSISLANLKGKDDFSVWDAEIATQLRNNDQLVINTGKALHTEEIVTDAQGIKHISKVVKFPVTNQNEKRLIGGMALDITELKTAYNTMYESDLRYQTLTEMANVGIFRTNTDGLTTYVNPYWQTLTGLALNDATGLGWLQSVHQDDKEAMMQEWTNNLGKNTVSKSEYRLIRPDGSLLWVIGQAVPEVTKDNQIMGYVGTITDVTQYKIIENELRTLNKELNTINRIIQQCSNTYDVDKLMNGMLNELLDVAQFEGGAVYIIQNNKSLRLVSEKNLALSPGFNALKFDVRAQHNIINACLANQKALVFNGDNKTITCLDEYINCNKNIPFHAAFPLMANDKCIGIACLFANSNKVPEARILGLIETLTTEFALAFEHASLFNELEDRVLERTKMLANAYTELETFSYSISHDLRAPLRAIDGFANMLSDDYGALLGAEGNRLLNVIRTSSKKMEYLIDDILSLAKISRKDIQKSSVDMALMAKEIYNELTTDAQKEKIIFQMAELPPANADKTLIRQLWVNIISNAIKFSGNCPQPKIEIGFETNAQETIYFVSDNGVGFDMKYSSKLFTLFQRLHTEKEFEGTGVGLAIVKSIMQKHHGKIWAESKPQIGTKIFFQLP